MLEGPYQSNRWQERWFKLEGVFLLFQLTALAVLACVFGYEWFAAREYLKLAAVFGSAVVVIALAIVTRTPLLAVGIVVPVALARFWP